MQYYERFIDIDIVTVMLAVTVLVMLAVKVARWKFETIQLANRSIDQSTTEIRSRLVSFLVGIVYHGMAWHFYFFVRYQNKRKSERWDKAKEWMDNR